ncbi:phosphatidyl-N-methylethanolamine N-methyltransferase-like [Lolium rigidum]|uniref:phosphatidyl-N-methylethanolamine N-methyltransferase-like n=1 Tax=Lolium rigidum TaxID=89674 RepID=UPI001F5C8065|nr:phosphatidyl-N-methylethanolamine N-methyltransferase-like [Lolium rigidum]
MASVAALAAGVGVLLPFPFYWALWSRPQRWVDLCGRGADPCRRMAQVSHVLKALQLLALASVASFSWPPPTCSLALLAFGQYLNFKVYQLLGESGTYYGVRFGKKIPWVTDFPFGYIKDPQYVGSILSLVALLCWVPYQYVLLWCLGYVFMILVESKEDPATRAKLLS